MKLVVLLLFLIPDIANAEIISIAEDQNCAPETDDCISTLQINRTDAQIKVENLMGPFYFSKANNQVFDCGGSFSRQSQFANIISEDGRKNRILHASTIADCGITIDGKFYWIAYESSSDQQYSAELFVFDKTGKEIVHRKANLDATVTFEYESNRYSVYIPPTV